jgi:three-Cys-motif partner protein
MWDFLPIVFAWPPSLSVRPHHRGRRPADDNTPRVEAVTVFESIGYWSEVKLEIVRKYAAAYSTILAAQPGLYHVYVDAFAGAGMHLSRTTGQMVLGSPLNALQVRPPFREYHLIDLDGDKTTSLGELVADRADVHVYEGDCNQILLGKVFPKIKYTDYRRGLVLVDPYGLHLDWNVLRAAGQARTIDLFLNFPVADMNRNVLWRNPEQVDEGDIARMTRYWGDDSWRSVAYTTTSNLFGWEEKTDNATIAEAFRDRLSRVAGFRHVPLPMPMRNSRNVVVYYLFFASQKDTANQIVTEIFGKYRGRQG